MKKVAIFCSGVAVGVIGTKLVPKTKPVVYTKYLVEVVKAQMRLTKVLHNEYWLIDEAINTENVFLNMIKPNIPITVSFSVKDEAGQRHIHTAFDQIKKGE